MLHLPDPSSLALLAAVYQPGLALRLPRQLAELRRETAMSLGECCHRLVSPPLSHVLKIEPERQQERGQLFADSLAKAGIGFLTPFDPLYPALLAEIPDPPPVLFYRGNPAALATPTVAIVGSRACTVYGEGVAREIATRLARSGVLVVSGLALGIDAVAHRACVEAARPTAAVLGSGLQRLYPAANHKLAQQILDHGGVLLSEFPPDCAPKPHHFPIRNRVISALSRAVLVVEAKAASGSLITARHALEQGREVFSVPGPIGRDASAGANLLIARGEAQMILSTGHFLELLKTVPGLDQVGDQADRVRIEDPLAKKIYDSLDAFVPTSLERLAMDLSIDIRSITAKIVALEAQHLVERKPGQSVVRIPSLNSA